MTRMTENYPPPAPQWTEPLPPAQEQQGTADVVKEQAADLGGSTVQAGKHTAQVVQQQASDVAAEASRQGRDLLQQAQSQVGEQVAQGQQRLASEFLSVSEELRSMAESSQQNGTASELARQAASRAHDVGRWLDARGPADVVNELQSFARRRPGMFLALAAGAGLIAGRLTRGLKDAGQGNGAQPSSAWSEASAKTAVPPAPYPAAETYPPVSAPETLPGATAASVSGEGRPWAVEETYVEETYIQPEPLHPGDQEGPGSVR
jgi:hypothetical protein